MKSRANMILERIPAVRSSSVLKSDLLALAMLGLLASSGSALAEGRCPPGQYPIGGQGVGGCAPIGSTGSSDSSPVATGRWHKTWGAFALSKDGAGGLAVGQRRKGDAAKEAERVCATSGSSSCKVSFTFYNQCGAAVVPTSGSGGTLFGSSETAEKAEKIALDRCSNEGGLECKVVYSVCSKPEFESF